MNICYISNEYPPDTGFGGIATYTRYAAEGMAARGHSVHVICRSVSGEPFTCTDTGVTIHRVGAGSYPLWRGRAAYLLRLMARLLFPHALVRLAWAGEAYKTLRSLHAAGAGFDIVEFPECGAEGYYAVRGGGYKTVARLHTPWEMVSRLDKIREAPPDKALLSYIERTAARGARAATSPTRALALALEKHWGIKSTAIFPNPIPASRFKLTEGNSWIYTGRVERRKGTHVLVAAYSNLAKSVDVPRLRIVGKPYGPWDDGTDYGGYIETMIERLGLGSRIEWIRGTDNASVQKLLCQSSVAVFPSLWENFSYGCLEAMASGCAVAASRCGGFPEMISHGETGLLFTPGDAEELTQTLYRLYKQDDVRRKIGIAGRARVAAQYDTEVVAGRMESFYRGVLEGKAHE